MNRTGKKKSVCQSDHSMTNMTNSDYRRSLCFPAHNFLFPRIHSLNSPLRACSSLLSLQGGSGFWTWVCLLPQFTSLLNKATFSFQLVFVSWIRAVKQRAAEPDLGKTFRGFIAQTVSNSQLRFFFCSLFIYFFLLWDYQQGPSVWISPLNQQHPQEGCFSQPHGPRWRC